MKIFHLNFKYFDLINQANQFQVNFHKRISKNQGNFYFNKNFVHLGY